MTFSRRVLYTTNTKVEFPGVSWLGITSRSVDFMANQPDLPDRTLVLKMERLGEKQPESELLSAIAQYRDAMWSELLDELNVIVRHLRQEPQPVRVQFRMADFASFALNVATAWGCRAEVEAIFTKLEEAQADLVFENEPVHQILELWLTNPSNQGRRMDAAILYREWSFLANQNQILWPFSNPQSLGIRLVQLRHALEQRFNVTVARDPHEKQNCYRFWLKGVAEEAVGARPPVDAALLADPEASAGIAGTAG